MNSESLFEQYTPRKGYVSPETFHRFMNEVVGLKLGKNAVYAQLASGKIRALRTGTGQRTYQIPLSELEGDYEARLLAEEQGKTTVHQDLLGTPLK